MCNPVTTARPDSLLAKGENGAGRVTVDYSAWRSYGGRGVERAPADGESAPPAHRLYVAPAGTAWGEPGWTELAGVRSIRRGPRPTTQRDP